MLARAGPDLCAPGVHQHAAIRLLIVTYPNHVDRALQSEELARQSEGAAPLSRPGFGGQAAHAGALVVVCLRNRSVGLVAARGASAFVLVVDVGRSVERLLEPARAVERGCALEAI